MNRIGIIGGSGLYHLEGFTRQKWVKVKTPFGPPSDELLTGELAGRDVVFLAGPYRRVGKDATSAATCADAAGWAARVFATP